MLAKLRNWSKIMRIGLDIAQCGVRAVQCRRSGDVYSIVASAILDDEQTGDEATKSSAEIAQRIRSCTQLSAFGGRSVAIALSPPDIEFMPVELPAAVLQGSAKDARQILRFEVDRLTTFTDKELEVDFWPLPRSPLSKPNTMAAATMSETVLERVRGCEEASLSCACLDAAAAALARMGSQLHAMGDADVWAILDLGYHTDRLIVCVDATPILIRNVGKGGHHLTTCIAESLQISLKTAEIQKRDHGLAAPNQNPDSANPVDPTDEVAALILQAVRPELNEMASEIKRSYEYVLSCYPSRRARDLILVGGGADMRHLDRLMASLLGIAVRRAQSYLDEPTCNIRVNAQMKDDFDRLALATGLSMEPSE